MRISKCIIWSSLFCILGSAPQASAATFVGSQACGECHEEEYSTFKAHSKKATTRHSIEKMASDLDPEEVEECFACHSTGYGQGGFTSYEATPHLADVGCETCHGPGAEHAESGDPEWIIPKPTLEQCETCHTSSRIEIFNFKPLRYSGAH